MTCGAWFGGRIVGNGSGVVVRTRNKGMYVEKALGIQKKKLGVDILSRSEEREDGMGLSLNSSHEGSLYLPPHVVDHGEAVLL